ncbi:hypothetical protein [Kribbella sp. NPDC051770]|uniref:hypothetical protein n=1 Tax=Kribbella sp. NPDC051770 TaxID=3155413 RepID=UPI00341C1D42
MKLLLEVRPVEHLEASVEYYRGLGLVAVGWPDDETALLAAPGSEATIVLVRDPAEAALGAGGVYDVGGVDDFYRTHEELDWLIAPVSTALGRYAVFADRTGTCVRLLDPDPHLGAVGGTAFRLYAAAG